MKKDQLGTVIAIQFMQLPQHLGPPLQQLYIHLHRLQRIQITHILLQTTSPANIHSISINSISDTSGDLVVDVGFGVSLLFFN